MIIKKQKFLNIFTFHGPAQANQSKKSVFIFIFPQDKHYSMLHNFFFNIYFKTEISKILLYLPKTEIFKKLFYIIPQKSLAQLKHVSQSLFVKQFYEAVRILEYSFSILNQPFLVFRLEEDFYIVCDHIFYFRFCLFKKDFYVFHKHMEDFYFSLLQKDLDTPFMSLFLMPFFALLIISSQHFYIQEKNYIRNVQGFFV